MKNMKYKINCFEGLIKDWKKIIFENGVKKKKQGIQISFNMDTLKNDLNESETLKMKVFKKCQHAFSYKYLEQFYTLAYELNYVSDLQEKELPKVLGKAYKSIFKCPLCKFSFEQYQNINNQLIYRKEPCEVKHEQKKIFEGVKEFGNT